MQQLTSNAGFGYDSVIIVFVLFQSRNYFNIDNNKINSSYFDKYKYNDDETDNDDDDDNDNNNNNNNNNDK